MYKRLQYAKEILIQMINKQDTIDGRRVQEEKVGNEKMAETARNLVRPSSNMMEILAGSST